MKIAIATLTDTRTYRWKECLIHVGLSRRIIPYSTVHYVLVNDFPNATEEAKTFLQRYNQHSIVIKRNDYLGLSLARNTVSEQAYNDGNDVIIWIDDDIIVPKDQNWLSPFITPFEVNLSCCMTGTTACIIQADFGNQWYIDVGELFDYLDSPYALRLSHWDALGRYDTRFVVCCDNTDLCLRAWANGYILAHIISEGIIHYRQGTLGRDDYPFKAIKGEKTKEAHSMMIQKRGVDWKENYGMIGRKQSGRPQYLDIIHPQTTPDSIFGKADDL